MARPIASLLAGIVLAIVQSAGLSAQGVPAQGQAAPQAGTFRVTE